VLDIRDGWDDAPGPSAMVCEPDGSGSGISIVDGADPVEQIVDVTGRMQDLAIEALWSARRPVTWPPCPVHPNSHPLEVAVEAERAVWRCPRSRATIAEVGALATVS
jgi:hypothetical protein